MTTAVHEQLCTATRKAMPREMCAVLGGQFSAEPHIDVLIEVRNDAHGDDAFQIAPQEFAAAEALLREHRRDVVGFAHSHPTGSATPSERDRKELWPDYVHVIVAPQANRDRPDALRMRAFSLLQDGRIRHLVLREDHE